MKKQLKLALNECRSNLQNIPNNFSNYDNTILYNSINNKVSILLSIIDQVEPQYINKALNNLEEIQQNLLKLSKAQQKP